jgi:hypothetical protein
MCQAAGRHHAGAMSGACGCGCLFPHAQRRHFSAEEKLEMLQIYEDELSKEIKGVQERIEELEKE